jgi:DnaJ-class molecular chaperone
VLGLEQQKEPTQSDIKKAYRKLSIVNHPDKIKSDDPDKEKKAKLFEQIRMAYEILSNEEYRGFYDVGGALLVKNVETMYKEMEGQTAQMMAQLDQQVPKNHPMRSQAEAQIKAQQKDKNQMKHEIMQKMKNEDTEVEVQVELDDLFQGAENKEFSYSRLEICKGCRACNAADVSDEELNSATCQRCASECGKCPPEIRQIPKMHGPFMVGSKEQEVESREKCATRKLKAKVRLPASATDGQFLKKIRNKGHETPGRIPGDVKLVVKRKQHSKFTILDDSVSGGKNDLFTVLTITLEESLKGFVKSFLLFEKEKVVIDRSNKVTEPDQVIKLPNKGMHLNQVRRSDLYIRVRVQYPETALDESASSFAFDETRKESSEANLSSEDELNVKDGKLFRKWDLKRLGQDAGSRKKRAKKNKEEL